MLALQHIRDDGPVSSRNSTKGALVQETFEVFRDLNGNALELRRAIIDENFVRKKAFHTRRTVWNSIKHRYLVAAPEWVVPALSSATEAGLQSAEFLSLAYLYYVLRDRITYEFVVGPLWERWQAGQTRLTRSDALVFLHTYADREDRIKKWHETTRKMRLSLTFVAGRFWPATRDTDTDDSAPCHCLRNRLSPVGDPMGRRQPRTGHSPIA